MMISDDKDGKRTRDRRLLGSSPRILLLPNQTQDSSEDNDSELNVPEKINHDENPKSRYWPLLVSRTKSLFFSIPCAFHKREQDDEAGQYSFSYSDIGSTQLERKENNYRPGVIPLTATDSDFPIAQPIRDAMIQCVHEGYMNYGPSKTCSHTMSILRQTNEQNPTCILYNARGNICMFRFT